MPWWFLSAQPGETCAKSLLYYGAIVLQTSSGTFLHAALRAIRGKMVFYRAKPNDDLKIVALGWPAPGDMERDAPVKRANALCELYVAFFKANVPMHDVQNCCAAFDLAAPSSLMDRRVLLRALAERMKLDAVSVWDAFAGAFSNAFETGAFNRAKWYDSASGRVANASGRFLREIENRNPRAWLRTHTDWTSYPEWREELIKLVELYLLSVPGTPAVERWLGEVVLVALKRRARKMSLASVKPTKQDLRGKRPSNKPLDPTALLVKPTAGPYGLQTSL